MDIGKSYGDGRKLNTIMDNFTPISDLHANMGEVVLSYARVEGTTSAWISTCFGGHLCLQWEIVSELQEIAGPQYRSGGTCGHKAPKFCCVYNLLAGRVESVPLMSLLPSPLRY